MQGKRTAAKRSKLTTVAWVALVAFLTFYIIFQLNGNFSPELTVDTATAATERLSRAYSGYILRNEVVLTSENQGYCDYLITDGGYSASGAELARVYPTLSGNAAERISAIDERIALLEVGVQRLTTGGFESALSSLGQKYRDLTSSLSAGDTSSAIESTDGLLEYLYSLEQNSGPSVSVDSRIEAARTELASLKSERSSILAALGTPESIVANTTGNFFYAYDGYEEVLSSADIFEIDYFALSDKLNASPVEEFDGTPIGTYRLSYEWFFVVPCEMSESLLFTVGRGYDVSFAYSSGHTLRMTLERLVSDPNGTGAFLVFSCGSTPGGFENVRCQTVEIEIASHVGYRVRNEAIHSDSSGNGVFILAGGKVSWRRVEVIYDNGLYSIVKPQPSEPTERDPAYLNLNDTYILSGSGLYEGKLID